MSIPQFKIERVRAAVAEYVAAQADGKVALYSAEDGVAKILGVTERRAGYSGARLEGQIYRTLNQMAERGDLVKKPTSKHRRTVPVFYTPDAWKAQQAADAAEAADKASRRQRWAVIHDQLDAWGLENTNTLYGHDARGRAVHLDLGDFESLMARARRGSET